jgi:hypothetical protein
MPGQHSKSKECVSAWVPRTLAVAVKKAAKAKNITITDFLEEVYRNATADIVLNDEDREEIARAERRAHRRLLTKRTQDQAAKAR